MRDFLIIFVGLLVGNAIAKPINQLSITTHSYKLDRDGLWKNSAVSNTLRDTEKTNAILSLNGDISGIEYQLKHETEAEKITVQKLFYIKDINDNLSVQMGRFIENWQLGYAFNPLAITDPYHPTNNNDDLSKKFGINAIAMRYTAENTYLDFYVGNDTRQRNAVRGYGYKSQGARFNYILNDNIDLTFIFHKKEGVKTGFGAGFRHIASNNSKLYGSFFTRKGTTLASLDTSTATVGIYRENNGKRYTHSMLGWHWVSDNNASIIAEISQDDRGMNNQEWKNYKLRDAAGLTLVRPNGLRQRYHFLRLGKIINNHELSLSRRTSTDNSALNTLKWTHNITDNLQFNASHSQTTGDVDSEYKIYFPDQSKTDLVLHYNLDF